MQTDIWVRANEAMIALQNGVIQMANLLGEYGEEVYNYIMGLG